MSHPVFIQKNNSADINILRDTVRKLHSALEAAEEEIEILKKQRDSQIVEASAFANTARTYAKELGVDSNHLKNLRLQCQEICQNDCNKRGIFEFAANPPKFTLNLK